MVKQIAALEISNRYYKLVIGYTLDNKVDILYKVKKPLSVPFKDGDIFDIGSLADDLSKIKNIEASTKNVKTNINLNEVVLVLPPYGLQVYHSVKTTNTVSSVSKIDRIDINNALSLIKKEKIPNINDELIDIIPNKFIIDNDKTFLFPPLNQVSQAITIDANVYTLPKKMVSDMVKACENAQINVKREVIAPVGVSSLLTGTKYKYPIYVLIDFSNKTTSLSFIGNGVVYGSNFFSLGIDDLINKISSELGIDKAKTEEIVNIFGLDNRQTSYNPTIAIGKDSIGIEKKYTKEDLVKVSLEFLKTWIDYFKGSLVNLVSTCAESLDSPDKIALVFTGEGTKLNGLKEYLLKVLTSNPIEFLSIPTICCREPEFANCLGAIYMASSYRGALEDENKQQVTQINRVIEDEESRFEVKREKYNELKDELWGLDYVWWCFR